MRARLAAMSRRTATARVATGRARLAAASRAAARPVGAAAVALLVLGGLGGVGCSSQDQLDMGRSERQIVADLSKTYAVPVTDAQCPDKVVVKRGAAFRCTVAVGGASQRLEVQAVQRNDKGDLLVAAKAAVVHTDQVAADISGRLNEQFKRSFVTNCGAAATKVVAPGSQFDCQAADGSSRRVVTATVQDAQGTLTYEVRDPAATAGTAPPATAPGPSTTVGPGAAATTAAGPRTTAGQELIPVTPTTKAR